MRVPPPGTAAAARPSRLVTNVARDGHRPLTERRKEHVMATPLTRRPEGNGASPQVVPAAGRYRLDPSHTVVAFRTRHLFGLGAVSGTMAVTGGEITIDPAVPQASVTATISAASVRTGNRARDRDARARFLHTGQYPDITSTPEPSAAPRTAGCWPVTWRYAG
jgi:polyisoprenoid-binding protein YceI